MHGLETLTTDHTRRSLPLGTPPGDLSGTPLSDLTHAPDTATATSVRHTPWLPVWIRLHTRDVRRSAARDVERPCGHAVDVFPRTGNPFASPRSLLHFEEREPL